jgi:pyruvate carboxylase
MRIDVLGIVAVAAIGATQAAYAQQSTAERVKLMREARNVCLAIAKFIDTDDPTSEITYDQGRFRIVRTKSGATVMEGDVKIADMPKLDYEHYEMCLEKMTGNK